MKKLAFLLLVSMVSFLLVACGEETTTKQTEKEDISETNKENETKTTTADKGEVLSEEEFAKMVSDPKKYKGKQVVFFGKIFREPEKDDDGTYLQLFDKNDNNIIVGIKDTSLNVKADDLVKVEGVVHDVFEGENAFGGIVEAPLIVADKVEISDYASAFAPAIKTIEVNQEQEQHGYKMTLHRLEIAENETRAYVSVANNSDSTIYFYTFNAKVLIGSKQLDEANDYNYEEMSSDILPGIQTEGIVVFPTIANETGEATFYFEASSDNYDVDYEPFQFKVSLDK